MSAVVRDAIGALVAEPGVICISGELAEQIRQAADSAGVTPKAWLEVVARERLAKVQTD